MKPHLSSSPPSPPVARRAFEPSVGVGWVVLDVLAGFVPLVVDLATDNWRRVDEFACYGAL